MLNRVYGEYGCSGGAKLCSRTGETVAYVIDGANESKGNGKRATALRRVRLHEQIKTLKGKSQERLALKNGPEVLGEENR